MIEGYGLFTLKKRPNYQFSFKALLCLESVRAADGFAINERVIEGPIYHSY